MFLEKLCHELRQALNWHHCRHKICDCTKVQEFLEAMESIVEVRYPRRPERHNVVMRMRKAEEKP